MFLDEKREGEAQVREAWRDQLLFAARLLREKGWFSFSSEYPIAASSGFLQAQESFRKVGNGNYCALTAIYHDCSSNNGVSGIAAKKLCEYLRLEPPPSPYSHSSMIPTWNDAPGRTVEEVIAALEGAAAA